MIADYVVAVLAALGFAVIAAALVVASAWTWLRAVEALLMLLKVHREVFWFIRLKLRPDLSRALTELVDLREARRADVDSGVRAEARARAAARWAGAWKRAAKSRA